MREDSLHFAKPLPIPSQLCKLVPKPAPAYLEYRDCEGRHSRVIVIQADVMSVELRFKFLQEVVVLKHSHCIICLTSEPRRPACITLFGPLDKDFPWERARRNEWRVIIRGVDIIHYERSNPYAVAPGFTVRIVLPQRSQCDVMMRRWLSMVLPSINTDALE